MKFSQLGSGSKGNALYIEAGTTALLIDSGFSGKELERRLQSIGRSVQQLRAICLTHEHNDHISGVGVLSRRCRLPVYSNIGTLHGGEKKMGKLHQVTEFETGDSLVIDDLQVRSFRVSHDTEDPVGFLISDGRRTLGYCTDTGKITHLMAGRLSGCDGLILEFNHDLELLKHGPYPLPLQQRVRSSHGHLQNEDAADFLAQISSPRLQMVVLAHLSEVNNNPDLALAAAKGSIADMNTRLVVARQDQPMELVEL